MENSEKVKLTNKDMEYVKKLLLLPPKELDALLQEKTKEEEKVKATYKNLTEEVKRLEAKVAKVNEEVNFMNETKQRDIETVKSLEKNNEILRRQLIEIEKGNDSLLKDFSGIAESLPSVERAFEDRNVELYVYTEEVNNEMNDIETKIKEAETEYALKRESLDATLQVLESKIACYEHDKQEVEKLQTELDELKSNNYGGRLIELEKQEQSLKAEISQLNTENENLTEKLRELEANFTTLTKEAEDLPQKLDHEVKNNEKLREELQNVEKLLMDELAELASKEAKMIIRENLDIAKILKEDLSEIDKLTGEIKTKKDEYGVLEKQFEKLTAEVKQVNEKIENVEEELAQEKNVKNNLKGKIAEQYKSIKNKKKDINALKAKIKENGKLRKTNSEIEITISKQRDILDIDPDEMDLIFADDSSSSSGSNWNFSMSSTYNGSRPDLSEIIARLGTTNDNTVSSTNDYSISAASNPNRK